jgi:predicted DNA-binding transcriptional regulator YafY
VAYDIERHDWRSFRVDRLSDPATTGARFRTRQLPADDAAAFVREGFASLSPRYPVEVTIHAPAADVEAVASSTGGTVEDIGDGACRLTLSVEAFDWMALILAAVNAEFDVVSPPELRDYLGAVGERFLRAAGPRA